MLPVKPYSLSLVLALAACQPRRVTVTHELSLHVSPCGPLCGDAAPRAPTDFGGLECAVAARVRALSANGATLAEQCVALGPQLPIATVFGPAATERITLDLPLEHAVSFEVSLYAPRGAVACPAEAPLVGLGRSAAVDLALGGEVNVPLGCHKACGPGTDLPALLQPVDTRTPQSMPGNVQVGAIFPYNMLISTDGQCTAPQPATAELGQFRPYASRLDAAGLHGPFGFEDSPRSGCLAVELPPVAGTNVPIFGCALASGGALRVATLTDAQHVAAALALQPADARSGVLVVGVRNGDGSPAEQARVFLGDPQSQREGAYAIEIIDDQREWYPIGPGSISKLGVALFPNAPVGTYTVVFADGGRLTFQAGGVDNPRSITTIVMTR